MAAGTPERVFQSASRWKSAASESDVTMTYSTRLRRERELTRS